MSDTTDYSKPVGWWCPVCGHHENETDLDVLWNALNWLVGFDEDRNQRVPIHLCTESSWCIPVYKPIPQEQRPLIKDELRNAEVVTVDLNGDGDIWYMDNLCIRCVNIKGEGWTFNDIAEFSRAQKKVKP